MNYSDLSPIANEFVCLSEGFLASIFFFLLLRLSLFLQLVGKLLLNPTLGNPSFAFSWLRQLPMKKREVDITIVRGIDVNVFERDLTKMNLIGGASFLQFLDIKNSD